MSVRQPKYSMEEHARRGREIYQRLLPQVEAGNKGRIVAIDIDTEQFELGENTLAACDRLLARLPEAQIWCERIGFPGVHHFSPRMVASHDDGNSQ